MQAFKKYLRRYSGVHSSRWLWPGMGIKRWILFLAVGIIGISVGMINLLDLLDANLRFPRLLIDMLTWQFLPAWPRFILPLIMGAVFIYISMIRIGRNLTDPFRQESISIAEVVYEENQRRRGPRIVAIGGGTGMPSLLRGLVRYTQNITAIVTVADDGGSSGRLRRELGLLPPGDFRNNIAALSRDEALMTQVLQYRFGKSVVADEREDGAENGRSDLQGHAFGNLLLAALTGITGSFDEALLAAEKVLAMRGRVLPSTLSDVSLGAEILTEDGRLLQVMGESKIPQISGIIQRVYLQPANVKAYPAALQAIFQADMIIMGPGSLYTSILPNLLVPDLTAALQRASGFKIYLCNLATQPGETDNYSVADHVSALLRHVPPTCLDLVLANNNLSVPTGTGGGQTIYVPPVMPQTVPMMAMDLVDVERPWRHDSNKLAAAMMQLLKREAKDNPVR